MYGSGLLPNSRNCRAASEANRPLRDQVPEEQMLRTCVKAGKARLLLPEITRRCLEVAIDEDDLFVYKGTLQVGHGH